MDAAEEKIRAGEDIVREAVQNETKKKSGKQNKAERRGAGGRLAESSEARSTHEGKARRQTAPRQGSRENRTAAEEEEPWCAKEQRREHSRQGGNDGSGRAVEWHCRLEEDHPAGNATPGENSFQAEGRR